MLVLAPAACCLAGLALSELLAYLGTSLASADAADAAAAEEKPAASSSADAATSSKAGGATPSSGAK